MNLDICHVMAEKILSEVDGDAIAVGVGEYVLLTHPVRLEIPHASSLINQCGGVWCAMPHVGLADTVGPVDSPRKGI